jgi:hypothetical protein
MKPTRFAILSTVVACALAWTPAAVRAATLTVRLANAQGVTLVGAFDRWDADGNAHKLPNQKGKIDVPDVDFTAVNTGKNQWQFQDLKPGKYDLVIMLAANRTRIEGFVFPPVQEFDPFFPGTATCDQEVHDFIVDSISKDPQYENKVEPFYMGGDKKMVRVLVQLIRDLPTSYIVGAGTMRHEIWQYTWKHGGWVKEKQTRVLDRTLLQVKELRKWHWLWEPALGGIEIKRAPVTVHYQVPRNPDPAKQKGLYPY